MVERRQGLDEGMGGAVESGTMVGEETRGVDGRGVLEVSKQTDSLRDCRRVDIDCRVDASKARFPEDGNTGGTKAREVTSVELSSINTGPLGMVIRS